MSHHKPNRKRNDGDRKKNEGDIENDIAPVYGVDPAEEVGPSVIYKKVH
jgi:hypothetical protein